MNPFSRRRLGVQLTPLLDLLLIVMFAQYLEVRQQQTATADEVASAQQQLEESTTQLDRQRQTTASATQALQHLRSEMLELAASRLELEVDRDLARQNLDRSLAQQRVLGELVVELFDVPPADIDRVLNPQLERPVADSEAELEALRERFRDMSTQQAGRMIQHLLTYEEIRKRTDVWNLHIDGDDILTFDTGTAQHRFRFDPDNPAQLEQQLYDLYKSLPQTKGLVILLQTRDADTFAYTLDQMSSLLRRLIVQMRDDAAGRVRFEYADLGVRVP